VYFALVAIITPFMVIAPAYAKPQPLTEILGQVEPFSPPLTFAPAASDQTGRIDLLYAYTTTAQVYPEDYAEITIGWQVEERLDQNWSIFVHLVTSEGVIISQRDIYPG